MLSGFVLWIWKIGKPGEEELSENFEKKRKWAETEVIDSRKFEVVW
jgi:hypothetical protein